MRLTRDNMQVVTAEWDKESDNHWYKLIVYLPNLHLETPNFHTSEFGHDLIEMIVKQSDKCPHCGKDV
jgi:hypothetical protein